MAGGGSSGNGGLQVDPKLYKPDPGAARLLTVMSPLYRKRIETLWKVEPLPVTPITYSLTGMYRAYIMEKKIETTMLFWCKGLSATPITYSSLVEITG